MENMHNKIRIVAEKDALIQLFFNKEFYEGKTLKHIFRNLADIILIMDEREFDLEWNNLESDVRKFFDAYDIPRPQAISNLIQIYNNPGLCPKFDPFALWLFNRTEREVINVREALGVWALSPQSLSDEYLGLSFPRGYDKDDEIDGSKNNGWGNYLEQLPKALPPINSIVLNDRYLLLNTNERTASQYGFYGLNNLQVLLDELLPQQLMIPFHILIFCQHPKLSINDTDTIVRQFISNVKNLRDYPIEIEIVYDNKSRHKRDLYTNYYRFGVDRGFNAFKNKNMKRLNGENDFNIVTYLNDPFTSGDTEYDSARSKIDKIKKQCTNSYSNPNLAPVDEKGDPQEEMIIRTVTNSTSFFINRLFSINAISLHS